MSASSSDSGGSDKPPNQRRKKKRAPKRNPSPKNNNVEPTQEAATSPNEEALYSNMRAPNLLSASAATDCTADIAAALSPRKTMTPPTVVVPESQEAVTCATTSEASKALANAHVLKNSLVPSEEFPKLTEVVKAASASAPAPNPIIMRPPLSGVKTKKKEAEKKETAASTTSPVSVASGPTYAQQVSGSSNKNSFIEIQGKYVAPRSPPSDLGKPRPKSDVGLQGVFDGRWQDDRYGVHFEHIRGSTQGAYLKAVSSVIPRDNIFSFGLVGRGTVELYTTDLASATKLMLEGIEVGGRHLTPYPVSIKPTRVVFSRVPMRADHEDLLNFLRKFGKVHGKARAIPLKTGEEGLGRGIFSTSREAFVTLNQGCSLPAGFYLSIAGSRSWIEVATEAKCYACHQVGHFAAACPKRTRKAAEDAAKEAPVSALTPEAASLPNAAPPLEEHSVDRVPEVQPEEAKCMAQTGTMSTREGTATSGGEQSDKTSTKKKLTKRRSLQKPDQAAMPPPASSTLSLGPTSKRPHSGEESDSRSTKVLAVESTDTASYLSDCEMAFGTEEGGLAQSGYESCGSTISVGSRFEVAKELKHIPREKLRSLLDSLHYKKSADRIWDLLQKEIGDPEQILPQLKLLQRESKKKRKYNEAARCERLYNKVLEMVAERRLDDSLRQ